MTVALCARHGVPTLAHALHSVLEQAEVDCEVFVVADGSASLARSIKDPRVTFIEAGAHRSAGYGYNLALERSRGAFFATIHPTCALLPGALRKLLDACWNRPGIGMAQGYYFPVDSSGRPMRDAIRSTAASLQELFTPPFDYGRLLLRQADTAQHVRLYTTSALAAVGRFDPRPGIDTDLDIALKIADRFRIAIVSECLYYRYASAKLKRAPGVRRFFWTLRRAIHCRRLVACRRITFLDNRKILETLLANCWAGLGGSALVRIPAKKFVTLCYRLRYLAQTRLYHLVAAALSNCSAIHLNTTGATATGPPRTAIGYYTWHFPVLSQTFINRELAALKQAGTQVEIFADEPEPIELADDNAREVLSQAHYLDPVDSARLRRYRKEFLRSHPLEYLKVLALVISCRYGSYKTFATDIAVFYQAIYLAGVARERGVDHLHAPWSDRCAFVAMLAARIAGISYSVQARAHDIHRTSDLFALAEKFEPAEFIVTNTRYNEAYMKTFLRKSHWPKLRVIHNGLDLARFEPPVERAASRPLRILCVARLIEQKGLVYLLKACAELRARGHAFSCEIIGGTEDIFMNYYLEVKRLHRDLGLRDVVLFRGSLIFNEVLKEYSKADIFVLPCVIAADGSRDIIPNALLEAMAMKLPVISTTVTGIPEMVEHGLSGILIPPEEENALADALEALLLDADLRRRLGEQARRRVEEKFDIAKNVTRYVRLFTRQQSVDLEDESAPLPGPVFKEDYVSRSVF